MPQHTQQKKVRGNSRLRPLISMIALATELADNRRYIYLCDRVFCMLQKAVIIEVECSQLLTATLSELMPACRSEPLRICRRLFGLSYAAMAGSSSMA